MNRMIGQYVDEIHARLIESPAIVAYEILRQEITSVDGKVRIKAATSDGGQAEFFIYATESEGRVTMLKYSFHWQDARGRLIRRWDNAPHYPNLPNAPHHIHHSDGAVSGTQRVPDMFVVLEEIEHALSQRQ